MNPPSNLRPASRAADGRGPHSSSPRNAIPLVVPSLIIALCLLQSGCAVVALGAGMLAAGAVEEAAMRPYDRALRSGRMNAIEYARQRSATERSVDSLLSPDPPPPRR